LTDANGTLATHPFFTIDGDQLVLRPDVEIDYEQTAEIDIFITAHDGTDGGATFTDTGVSETQITGGDGADQITAHDAGSTLDGAAGADTLFRPIW